MSTASADAQHSIANREAEGIAEVHIAVCQAAATTLERAIECGCLLEAAKDERTHGEWIPWLEAQRVAFGERFPAVRTAQQYMDLHHYRDWLPNAQQRAHLTLRGAIEEVREHKARTRVAKQRTKDRRKRTEEPRQVKDYLDALLAYDGAVHRAVETAEDGLFSPEAQAFIMRYHDTLREKMRRVEAAFK